METHLILTLDSFSVQKLAKLVYGEVENNPNQGPRIAQGNGKRDLSNARREFLQVKKV